MKYQWLGLIQFSKFLSPSTTRLSLQTVMNQLTFVFITNIVLIIIGKIMIEHTEFILCKFPSFVSVVFSTKFVFSGFKREE